MRCVGIDDRGITLQGERDLPVDVLFDDRRVLSFWWQRDSERSGDDYVFSWPQPLRRFLDGTTEMSLVDHVSGDPLYSGTVRLGGGEGRIRVEDAHGNPMGLDKSMRLSRLFDSRSSEHLMPLLDSIGTVLEAVEEAGLQPFLAYGTLLGAVRDRAFIGHDSDADIGYVSRHRHPFDAVLESFRVQRRLLAMGYEIHRYSGLAFKVTVRESDGQPRGLDVFGGFMLEDHLYLMGEVGHPFRQEWIEPRSRVTLEGREFPAPAVPERLLEVMYGEGWRVPDPAYKFETPLSAQRRLNGWFRGTRVGLDARWKRFHRRPDDDPSVGPTGFAEWVHEREPGMATAVDIGCGNGADVLWLAGQGVNSWGLDHFPRAFRSADRNATRQDLPARFEWTSLSQLRSVLATGALLSREPGPRVAMARHVADNTDDPGRDHLLRLAKMVVRDSGRLYLQVRTNRLGPADDRGGFQGLGELREQVERAGGVVEQVQQLDRERPTDPTGPTSDPGSRPILCRLVVTWHRRT